MEILTAEAFSTVLNIVNGPPEWLLFNFTFLEMLFLPLCCTVFFSKVLGPVVAQAVENTLPPQPRKSHTPKALRLGTMITGFGACSLLPLLSLELGGPVLSHLQVTASPVTVWVQGSQQARPSSLCRLLSLGSLHILSARSPRLTKMRSIAGKSTSV